MLILGIDPGPNDSGYVIWDAEGEVIKKAEHVLNHEILPAFRNLSIESGISVIAIEDPQAQKRPASVDFIETCKWVGRFQEAIERQIGYHDWAKLVLIPYRDVSAYFCKIVNAKEKFVKNALISRYGDPGKKKTPGKLYGITGHCLSALAVAVVAGDREEAKAMEALKARLP